MMEGVDVLLVTATEIERKQVLAAWGKSTGRDWKLQHGLTRTYYMLGNIGGANIALVQTEMGSVGPGGSLSTVLTAIDELHPTAVIMVGIAFGVDQGRQAIGQILVSKQVRCYEAQRVGTDEKGSARIVPRGDRVSAATWLLGRFQAASELRPDLSVKAGLILSGEKLVDNVEFRASLLSVEPEAIGGEMEGAGLFAAVHDRPGVSWIIVKAICDWADGLKEIHRSERQLLAAHNAATFALTTLTLGGFGSRQRMLDTTREPILLGRPEDTGPNQRLTLRATVVDWLSANGRILEAIDDSEDSEAPYLLFRSRDARLHLVHIPNRALSRPDVVRVVDRARQLFAADSTVVLSGRLTGRDSKYALEFPEVRICQIDDLILEGLPQLTKQLDQLVAEEGQSVFSTPLRVPFLDTDGDIQFDLSEYLTASLDSSSSGPPAHIAILGEFGSGKSRLLGDYAKRQFSRYRVSENSLVHPLPFYVEVGRLADATSASNLLADFSRNVLGCADPQALKVLLENGRGVLLIDGLDELFKRYDHDLVMTYLRDLIIVSGSERSRVVLTSRAECFPDAFTYRRLFESLGYETLRDALSVVNKRRIHFEVLKALPLDVDDVCGAILRVAPTPIGTWITRQHDLVELCRRPIMLQMLLSVSNELQRIDNPTEADVFHVAVRKQLYEDGLRSGGRIEDRLEFVHDLAWNFLIHGGEGIEQKFAGTSLARLNRDKQGPSAAEHIAIPHSGLLRWDMDGKIFFVHRSAAEFLVALRIAGAMGVMDSRFEDLLPESRDLSPDPLSDPVVEVPVSNAIRRFIASCVGSRDHARSTLAALVQSGRHGAGDAVLGGAACTVLRDLGVNFAGWDLSYLRLDCADFSGSNLCGVNFARTKLRHCNFANCDLSGADLSDADISHTSWGERGAIYSVAVDKSGSFMAVAVQGSGIDIHSVNHVDGNGAPIEHRSFRDRTVYDLAFAPDGLRLAWFASPGEVGVWSVDHRAEGTETLVRSGWDGRVCWVGPHWLAVASGTDLRLFNVTARLGFVPGPSCRFKHAIKALTAGLEPTDFLAADEFGTVFHYRFLGQDIRLIRSAAVHADSIRGLAVDSAAGCIVTGSKDGYVRLLDSALNERSDLRVGGPVFAVALRGQTVAASFHSGRLVVWRPNEGQTHFMPSHSENVRALSFLKATNRLIAVSYDGSVTSWQEGDSKMQLLIEFPKEFIRCDGLRLDRTIGVTQEHRHFFLVRGAIVGAAKPTEAQ